MPVIVFSLVSQLNHKFSEPMASASSSVCTVLESCAAHLSRTGFSTSAGTLRGVRGRSVEEERIKQGGSNGGPGGAGAGMEAEDADSGINCT